MYFDLIFGYKIMFGLVRVKFEDSFLHHRKEDMLTNCIKLVIAIPLVEFFFAESCKHMEFFTGTLYS